MSGTSRSSRWWWILSAGAVVVTVVGLATVGLSGPASWRNVGDQTASMVGALMAVVGVVVAVIALLQQRHRSGTDVDPAVLLDRAQKTLAARVALQWTEEARRRGLLRPEPLAIRWSSSDRPVAPDPMEVVGVAVGRVIRLNLHGDVTTVGDAWRQLPARQLVVIGAPGAGKTSLAVLVVYQLLATAGPSEAVPVLLNIAEWDPADHLDTWLARRLTDLYPWLADYRQFGTQAATRLVDGGRIVPILDGFDEMPRHRQRAAIEALDQAVGNNRPFLLTCRANEYEDIIATTGRPLARAAVVEIEPVTARQASTFLPAGQPNGRRRWATVMAALRDEPDGPLAQALSTPLMVYLARTAYTPTGKDPTALTAIASRVAVEEHLLAAYLPTIYAEKTPTRDADSSSRAYHAEQADRWLTYLARELERRNASELAWWRLVESIPRPVLAFAKILTITVATFLVFWDIGTLMYWAVLATAGVAALFMAGRLVGDGVSRAPTRFAFSAKATPRLLLRGWHSPAIWGLLGGGMATVVVRDTVAWITFGIVPVVGTVLVLSLLSPISPSERITPRATLRRDSLGHLVFVGVAGGFWLISVAIWQSLLAFRPLDISDRDIDLFSDFESGAVILYVFAVAFACGSASFGLQIARIWTTTRGEMPWRVMRFLEDAHNRGILRQVGAVFQFRHARLQEYLAGRDPSGSEASPAAPVSGAGA